MDGEANKQSLLLNEKDIDQYEKKNTSMSNKGKSFAS